MKRALLFLLAAVLLAPQAWADDEGAGKKAGGAVERGGKAAGRGIEKGADATKRGLKKGGLAVGHGMTKAAQWVQRKAGGKGGEK